MSFVFFVLLVCVLLFVVLCSFDSQFYTRWHYSCVVVMVGVVVVVVLWMV